MSPCSHIRTHDHSEHSAMVVRLWQMMCGIVTGFCISSPTTSAASANLIDIYCLILRFVQETHMAHHKLNHAASNGLMVAPSREGHCKTKKTIDALGRDTGTSAVAASSTSTAGMGGGGGRGRGKATPVRTKLCTPKTKKKHRTDRCPLHHAKKSKP